MITIYELLEVEENASKEEIEKSYQNLILEYQINPVLSEKENKENEMILNKLKIAYEILTNDEKRKKYDKDLANKRAEELLKNVSVTSNNLDENSEDKKESEKNFYDEDDDSEEYENLNENEENDIEEIELSKKDKNEVRKAAKRDFKENLKKAQKVEQEYNDAYNKAYNDYLRKMGYKVKEPITLKKIINTIIVILVTIVVCFIAWKIPPINRLLKGIYEENFIIKSLVDIVVIFFKSIFSIFK